jgi:4-hydroxy-tetrahydrodipicolinate synthase
MVFETMPMRRDGIFAALWTPAAPDGSLIDGDLVTLMHFLRRHGVHGILALGSTGEFLHFTASQRRRILERILLLAEKMPVVANVSHVNPRAAIELAVHARSAGAAAIAVLPPWFYPLTQDDLVEFFVQIGDTSKLPVLLYNFPELTGVRIELSTIAAVADAVPLAGIKQSGGQFDYHTELLRLGREKKFPVFTGSDTRLPEALKLGVAGCFGGLVNVFPDLLCDIFRAHESGQPEIAEVSAQRLVKMGEILGKVPFPLNVGAVMEARGLPVGFPKQVVSKKTEAARNDLVHEAKGLFREWKLI